MSDVLWQIDYETACERLQAHKIDEITFAMCLKRLGFDQSEIDEHLEVLTCP